MRPEPILKKLALAAAATGAVVPLTQGQTLYNVNQTITPGASLFIDLDSGVFGASIDAAPGYDLWIRFAYNSGERPAMSVFNGWDASIQSGPYVKRYTYGASLAFSDYGGSGFFEYVDSGPWNGGTGGGTEYAALRHAGSSQEAWMGIIYDDAGSSLTIQSFAVAPTSFNLTAGAVPEPAETAALMALLAGGAALYHRRRQKKAAALPMA